jgi:hypothetical protein
MNFLERLKQLARKVFAKLFPYLTQAFLLTVGAQFTSGIAADQKRSAD